MSSSIAAGRQLAVRTLRWQGASVAMVACAFLLKGAPWAAAALAAGLAVALGSWLAARVALGGGVSSAGLVLSRLVAGMGLKWGVVIAVLACGLRAGLPSLALLAGAVAAVITQMLVMFGQARVTQSHSHYGR